ncbi:hypothetical protein EVAR_51893_1 [Eumeta japonica]|uniref:Uncharacterized protein n=1 Tax=Eumeta variegata TaxID=151549 RepID=A0A4C1XK50_EUMVA|nr:hypothetical protein EVAR_51893_1 [Eumeta japonica]
MRAATTRSVQLPRPAGRKHRLKRSRDGRPVRTAARATAIVTTRTRDSDALDSLKNIQRGEGLMGEWTGERVRASGCDKNFMRQTEFYTGGSAGGKLVYK